MSCWQRPDWMQFFDCAYEHLTEPVYIWFPFGLTYLVAIAIAIGAAVGCCWRHAC